MKKTNKCKKCKAQIYENQKHCSSCVDIILFGSAEKAQQAYKQNFKLLGL